MGLDFSHYADEMKDEKVSSVEVLRKDINSYESLKKEGKKCLTGNSEECCFVHYPEIKDALLALEKQEKNK